MRGLCEKGTNSEKEKNKLEKNCSLLCSRPFNIRIYIIFVNKFLIKITSRASRKEPRAKFFITGFEGQNDNITIIIAGVMLSNYDLKKKLKLIFSSKRNLFAILYNISTSFPFRYM